MRWGGGGSVALRVDVSIFTFAMKMLGGGIVLCHPCCGRRYHINIDIDIMPAAVFSLGIGGSWLNITFKPKYLRED